MKKNILLILIIFALLLVITALVINSLGILEPAPAESAAPSAPVSTAPPEASPEPTPGFTALDDGSLKTIREDALRAMESCREAYLAADKGTAQNVVLSDAAVSSMVTALGEAGYSAIDYYGNCSMQNPEALAAFGEAISAGNDAQAGYFVVHPDGLVHEELLIYQSGRASLVTVSMQWDKKNRPEVYSSGQSGLESIRYSANGWLIYSRSVSAGSSAGKYSMVRVKAYDAERRALTNRYLSPVGYSENNLFTCDWSSGSWGELDFNSLYAKFYSMYYGADPLTYNTASTLAGLSSIAGSSMHLVPAEQFERVMSGYLEIGSDTLRARSDYSSARGGYYFLGTQRDYYSVTPHWPEPEISDYWYNSDGTLTMRVNAVYSWGGTDCLFTHEVTVRETETGFVYVSNSVLSGGEGEPPANILIGERKSQISLLG